MAYENQDKCEGCGLSIPPVHEGADPEAGICDTCVAKARLEYLRGEILAARISYGEIFELQSLVEYIEPGDTLLLEWAGVPEFPN
jgi:hypothetical protein